MRCTWKRWGFAKGFTAAEGNLNRDNGTTLSNAGEKLLRGIQMGGDQCKRKKSFCFMRRLCRLC